MWERCNSQDSVLISGLQTETSTCLVSLAGPINLAFLFCTVVWLQQKCGSMPRRRLTCSSRCWEVEQWPETSAQQGGFKILPSPLWAKWFHGHLITAPVAVHVIPSAVETIKTAVHTKTHDILIPNSWQHYSQILATSPTPVWLAKEQHVLVGLMQCCTGDG